MVWCGHTFLVDLFVYDLSLVELLKRFHQLLFLIIPNIIKIILFKEQMKLLFGIRLMLSIEYRETYLCTLKQTFKVIVSLAHL